MMLRSIAHRPAPRQGVILLVVLAMLTLFAIVGLTFVLFSDSTATSANINKGAETQARPDVDPELALSLFLGQLIYDCHDDQIGVQSALRGHSFARNMYGANFSVILQANGQPALDANGRPSYQTVDSTGGPILGNCLPYCGLGRYHKVGAVTDPFPGVDEHFLVNYQYFANDPRLNGKVRDPERNGVRASPETWTYPANSYLAGNSSYTYCDGNSMFLAYMDSATSEIKVPSFHRPWLGPAGVGFGTLAPSNPNWTNTSDPKWKYMVMCPRQAEHPNFPKTLDAGGHVKNADWAPGGCDSIWIDMDAPVMTMADGRKYKMLVAPLILDLDGRLNLNVAGNILGAGNAHRSNQGWGPWEMNPAKVLNSNVAPNEWQNIFTGSSYQTTTNSPGRYFLDTNLTPPQYLPKGPAPAGGTFLHNYAQIDFNGKKDPGQVGAGSPSDPYLLPTTAGRPAGYPSWHGFPYFPPNSYGNAVPVETTVSGAPESLTLPPPPPYNPSNHPSMFNTLRPSADNQLLSVQSMHSLLRSGGTGSEFITSDFRVLMNNLVLDPNPALALKRRNQITSLSMDLDRPSVIPYIWNPNDTVASRRLRMATNSDGLSVPTVGASIPFPTLLANRGAQPPASSEFDQNSWRSLLAQLGRVNLNRPLRQYPPFNFPAAGAGAVAYDLSNPTSATTLAYQAAVQDRQQLAADVFNVLQKVTGAVDADTIRRNPGNLYPLGVKSPEYQATRWLAQLAVNIVDYIDEDDYMTPWRWDPLNTTPGDMGWVFGVEMPRLTLNEAYAQVDNNNSDPQLHVTLPQHKYATLPYRMNVWLELHNPLPAETFPGQHAHSNANAQLQLNMNVGGSTVPVPVYQVVLTNPNLFSTTAALFNPANVTGDPTFPGTTATITAAREFGTGVTITTAAPHGFMAGELVTIAGVGVAGYNGTFWIASAGTTTFTYTATSTGLAPWTAGNPSPATATPGLYSTVNDWGPNAALNVITPANGAYNGPSGGNAGFYVLGAKPPPRSATDPTEYVDDTNDNPNLPTTFKSPQMSFDVPFTAAQFATSIMPGVSIVLRRLACPHLPPNNNPAAGPLYNPYITTDVMQLSSGQQVWDSRRYLNGPLTTAADHVKVPAPVLRQNRGSWGRVQPYSAAPDEGVLNGLMAQNPLPPLPLNQPKNTFFRQNARENTAPAIIRNTTDQTLKTSFDWLTHLDRPLISPMELMNVTGVRPHELTQWFAEESFEGYSTHPSEHLVTWTGADGRLLRFFEFVTTGSFQAGHAVGGRVPGKININTLGAADNEIFRAMVDAQPGNTFYRGATPDTTVVDPLFRALITRRTRNASGVPGPNDTPYLSLATGHSATVVGGDLVSTASRSMNDTLLRPGVNGALMLEPAYPSLTGRNGPYPNGFTQNQTYHPYQRFELLNKIYNNLTVRSNVFAVWMTVGFFEVEDDTTIPVKLGAEIGRSENRHVRHRMFAIVDRTSMQLRWSTASGNPGAKIGGPITVPNGQTYVEQAVAPLMTQPAAFRFDDRTNLRWDLRAGMLMVIAPNTNAEETVPLYTPTAGPSAGQLVGRFSRNHAAGTAFTVRANPGPWFRYNARSDTNVVPYLAIID
jgi:hypothetical protein